MSTTARPADLERIRDALLRAGALLLRFRPAEVGVAYKASGSPVTEADRAADDLLRATLPRDGEGWLSEETPDDAARLARRRVWIVDPLDGTREFLEGIPQWCVSIGLAEDGEAVAGGVYNPTAGELFLGAPGAGATLNGAEIRASARTDFAGSVVLVSRWALRRGRRRPHTPAGATVRPVGPLAYGLALVAAGRADAFWGRSEKAEWDIAAGAALIRAAGGHVATWSGAPLRLNRWPPRAPGIVACGADLARPLHRFLAAGAR